MGTKTNLESETVKLNAGSSELQIGARMEEEGVGESVVGGGNLRKSADGFVERVKME